MMEVNKEINNLSEYEKSYELSDTRLENKIRICESRVRMAQEQLPNAVKIEQMMKGLRTEFRIKVRGLEETIKLRQLAIKDVQSKLDSKLTYVKESAKYNEEFTKVQKEIELKEESLLNAKEAYKSNYKKYKDIKNKKSEMEQNLSEKERNTKRATLEYNKMQERVLIPSDEVSRLKRKERPNFEDGLKQVQGEYEAIKAKLDAASKRTIGALELVKVLQAKIDVVKENLKKQRDERRKIEEELRHVKIYPRTNQGHVHIVEKMKTKFLSKSEVDPAKK